MTPLLVPKKRRSGANIGTWYHEIYGKYSIIKNGLKYILETKFKDGSGGTDDLIRFKYKGKVAFKQKGNERGEYFVITSSKTLAIYDSMGLVATLRLIR